MAEVARNRIGISLAQLAASARHVIVHRCPNRRLARPSDLDLPMEIAVSDASTLLKCGDCGSTAVLAYPESSRDARKGRVR